MSFKNFVYRLFSFVWLGIGILVIVGTGMIFTGCSQFQKWQSDLLSSSSAERRIFEIQKLWVRENTEKDILVFRRSHRFSPVIYKSKQGERIIQANGFDGIVSYDRDTAQVIWRKKIPMGVESGGALVNDRLFFGANDGFFYSVNADSGEILWTLATRSENLSDPLLLDGVVYFLSAANTLYAVDAVNGKAIWTYTRQDPSVISIRGGSKPAYKDGVLYTGFSDGSLVAVDAKNGSVKWEKILNRNKKFKDLDTDPLIEGNFIYLLGYDDSAYCLSLNQGDLIWKKEKGGYGPLLIKGDFLYYASSRGEFVSLNKSSGQEAWSYKLKESGVATGGKFYKGMIVFGESQGSLKFLDAISGKIVGSFDPGRGIMSVPTIDEKNNKVYFISGEANLYALKAEWTWPAPIPYLR